MRIMVRRDSLWKIFRWKSEIIRKIRFFKEILSSKIWLKLSTTLSTNCNEWTSLISKSPLVTLSSNYAQGLWQKVIALVTRHENIRKSLPPRYRNIIHKSCISCFVVLSNVKKSKKNTWSRGLRPKLQLTISNFIQDEKHCSFSPKKSRLSK